MRLNNWSIAASYTARIFAGLGFGSSTAVMTRYRSFASDRDAAGPHGISALLPIVFSNSGFRCQALRDHPCRAHCSLRGRGLPSAWWRKTTLVDRPPKADHPWVTEKL